MGREDDRKRREDLRRRDDAGRREKVNKARTNLYDEGYAIAGKYVDGLLKDESMVPTLVRIDVFHFSHPGSSLTFLQNAFSTVLSKFGFDYHKLMTVDTLHDVDIGEGKRLLTHIVRIIESIGVEAVHKFDERCVHCMCVDMTNPGRSCFPSFRMIPTFGETTIRRFDGDVSALKRLTGSEIEDTLQVCTCAGLNR